MATITEDYVSFETAKLLNEKGFNEPTLAYAYGQDMISYYSRPKVIDPLSIEAGRIPLPTQQMAMQWLRENYNLIIVVYPVVTDDEGSGGCLWKFSISLRLETKYISNCLYTGPEIAVDTAIKYCLENLI